MNTGSNCIKLTDMFVVLLGMSEKLFYRWDANSYL